MAASIMLLLVLFLVAGGGQVQGGYSDHKYSPGDHVPLYANKVGPFQNPSETYRYFDLPFCRPDQVTEKREDLGEVLNGDRMVDAQYKLDFKVNKESEVLCKKKLTKEDLAKFREAVKNDYYFQMYYDDLPIWGFIGKVDKEVKADQKEPSEWINMQSLHHCPSIWKSIGFPLLIPV